MPSAQRVSWAKIRVTAVCTAAVIILLTLFYLLTGGTLLEEKATLYLYVPDATGLGPSSPVRVDGIDVGKVSSVVLSGSPQPNRVVKITITVERQRLRSIPDDSYAQLSSDTLIGDKFVDITSQRSPRSIQPGAEIVYKEQVDVMKRLDLAQFQKQLRAMDALLTDIEQGRTQVGRFIIGDAVYRDFTAKVRQLHNAMLEATSTTTQVGQALYSDKLIRELRAPFQQLDQQLSSIQAGVGTSGQLLRDAGAYEQVRAMAQGLRDSVAAIRKSDFMASDQMYMDWNRSIASGIQMIDDMNANPLLTTTEMYDNLNGMAREMEHTVRDFRQDPRKYLRLKVF